MLALMIVLRWVHIVSGILWVGAAVMLTFFVSPAARAAGESGQKFLGYMMQNTKFNSFIINTALATVVAGLILYGLDSNWFTSSWMSSGPGLGFGLGGASALIGLYYGFRINRHSRKLMQLSQEIQANGGPPTGAQHVVIQSLQSKLKTGGMLNAVFLLLASILMATARFWVF